MKNYDIVWTQPSMCSADSMPLGGHDVGCNIWAEDNQLLAYVCQSGAFDENGTLLKHCRLRLKTDEALFAAGYRQTLHLEDGMISVDLGCGEDTLHYDLWCAVSKPELHIRYVSSRPRRLSLLFDCWRYRDRAVTKKDIHQCRDYDGSPELAEGRVFTRKDVVEPEKSRLLYYHQNRYEGETLLEKLIHQQHCEPFQETIPDVLGGRIIGGLLRCDGFAFAGVTETSYQGVDSRGWQYENALAERGEIVLTLSVDQSGSLEEWKASLMRRASEPVCREDVKKWWNDYFAKSYIRIDEDHPDSKYFAIGRNYQLFRYMLGCNYYGKWPTKFNGGLFTFDEGRTPDFRMWSGTNHTAQNQRLVYWPMLKSGDFEAMKPQFDYYKRITPVSMARTRHFYGHGGAYYFEQGVAQGLCVGHEYSWNHSDGISYADIDNEWVRLHYSSGLEFALMILEYHRYSGADIDEYMEFVESTVEFYAQHYPVDTDGKLYIFPSVALETYRGHQWSKRNERYGCANPTDAVAGLRCVSAALVEYYKDVPEKRARFEQILEMCPDVAVARDGEERYFAPAESFNPTVFNCELPQLYPVFPYGSRGLSDEEKRWAKNAYFRKYPSADQYLGYSWHQNGIFAARLGLTEEAEKYLHIKLDDAPKRFPAFWGPGHDWTPDHNHGGSGMILLQEMLLQCEGDDEVLFLPAWNMEIDVSFKLHVPGGKAAVCEYRGGKFLRREVLDA